MLIHVDVVRKDIKKCLKKKWYPGLDLEVRRVIKLLSIDGKLPGEYPMSGFSDSSVLHARIKMPKASFGKSKGPRIVYTRDEVKKIVYVGGHKDKIYDTQKFKPLIISRLSDADGFYSLEEYMKLTEPLLV